mgnify:CR=1 FL=1
MQIYEELVARGLIAQVTDEEQIRDLVNNGKATITGTLKDQPDWIKVAEADKTVEHTVYVMHFSAQ